MLAYAGIDGSESRDAPRAHRVNATTRLAQPERGAGSGCAPPT